MCQRRSSRRCTVKRHCPFASSPWSAASRSGLLLVLRLGVTNARVLRVTRHGVALFLRDLVLRIHLVFPCIGHRSGGLAFRFGVRDDPDVLRLGFLHAHILVVARLRLACILCRLVVGIGLGNGRLVLGVALRLVWIGCVRARGKHTQRRGAYDLGHGEFHGFVL